MNRLGRFSVAVLLLSFGLSISVYAADWPMRRHDAARSGLQPTAGDLNEPTIAWSLDLGGAYKSGEIFLGDVTGDGRKDIATVVGGKVVLRDAENLIIWSSPALGISGILTLADFDRDGREELLAVRDTEPAGLIILDGRNGLLRWLYDGFDPAARSLPASQVAVADLNGDNMLDIVASPSRYLGTRAFSFADGYDLETPENNILWTYSNEVYGNTVPIVAGDLDNDGTAEVAFFENYRLTVLNGEDGTEQWVNDSVFFSYSLGLMQIANVDGDPQNELVAIGNSASYNLAITVIDVKNEAIEWQIQWYTPGDRRLAYADESLADFDGDGSLEIAVSVYNNTDSEYSTTDSTLGDVDGIDAADQWTTIFYDAATGDVRASIPNAIVRGIRDLTGDGKPEVIVQATIAGTSSVQGYGDLTAYNLVNNLAVDLWTISDAALALLPGVFRAGQNTADSKLRVAAQDLDADGSRELYVWVDLNGDSRADALRVYNADLEEPTQAVTAFETPEGEMMSLVGLGNEISEPGSLFETAIAVTDGRLRILDSGFSVAAQVRFGGYVAEPLIADLNGDGHPEVLVAAANRELRVYDSRDAGPGSAPELLWAYRSITWPIMITDDVDGNDERETPVCDCEDAINPRVVLLDKDGEEIWSHEFSDYGSAPMDFVFGRFNDDATRDLLVVITDVTQPSATNVRLVALSGVNGSVVWNVPTVTNNYFRFPLLVADVNADDIDDLIFADSTRIEYYDGEDGSLLVGLSDTNWSLNHLLADYDKDGDLELVLANARADYGVKLFELENTTAAKTYPLEYNEEIGSRWIGVGESGDEELQLVIPNGFGRLKVIGALSGDVTERYIREGLASGDEQPGVNDLLGVSTCDIDSSGASDALVGTGDGYLVGLDVATAEISLALNLGNPVGSPVPADVDADGASEILVATYDGRLNLVDQADLNAPAAVRDVAVNDQLQVENPQTDIDVTETPDRIGATWDAVAEASGYAYQVSDISGNQIVPWSDNGASTQIVLALNLVPGQVYMFNVRAYDASGRNSVATSSDGVVLDDTEVPFVLSLSATPDVFNPIMTSTQISAHLMDSTILTGYALEITSPSDTVLVSESAALNNRDYLLNYEWDGLLEGVPLADGEYSVTVTAIDYGENETSQTIAVTIDKQPPATPEITDPQDGATFGAQPVPVGGVAEALATVKVYMDDSTDSACTATTTFAGTWECSISVELSDGLHTLTAQANDAAGNLSGMSEEVGIVIDRTGPAKPMVIKPADGSIVKTAIFDVEGEVETGAAVVVFLTPSEDVLCRAFGDENGQFACETEIPLDDGDYTLAALASDSLENRSEQSSVIHFRVSTGSGPDGDVEPDGDTETDGDFPDGDLTDGDLTDGDEPDGDGESEADTDADADADADGDLTDGDSGCSGCQATGGNSPGALLILGIMALWLRRRVVS